MLSSAPPTIRQLAVKMQADFSYTAKITLDNGEGHINDGKHRKYIQNAVIMPSGCACSVAINVTVKGLRATYLPHICLSKPQAWSWLRIVHVSEVIMKRGDARNTQDENMDVSALSDTYSMTPVSKSFQFDLRKRQILQVGTSTKN